MGHFSERVLCTIVKIENEYTIKLLFNLRDEITTKKTNSTLKCNQEKEKEKTAAAQRKKAQSENSE